MADATDPLKQVTLVSEIGGRPLHGQAINVAADAVPIGHGEFTWIIIQCPNYDVDGNPNASSVWFGISEWQLCELVPGQFSEKIEGTELTDIYVRTDIPRAELQEQAILNIPYHGKLGARRRDARR